MEGPSKHGTGSVRARYKLDKAQHGSVQPGTASHLLLEIVGGSLAQWVLVELQGEVQPRQSGDLAGSLLGDLHYTCEVRPDTTGICWGQGSPASPSALPRASPCSSWVTTSSTGRWCSWRSRLLCW
uniref:Uncharacterized protein n=1 Tax=Catharus ustulatus TaxID=91951 RepID=A0A8C3UVC6_CATUS